MKTIETCLHRSIQEPIRPGLTWDQQWMNADHGLIRSWERGREMRALGTRYPEADTETAADRAGRGELLRLPWRGGIGTDEEPPKEKLDGALQYLAMWQGLRAEDLNIDLIGKTKIRCVRTGTLVTFRRKRPDDW